jgi:hypothetical protein
MHARTVARFPRAGSWAQNVAAAIPENPPKQGLRKSTTASFGLSEIRCSEHTDFQNVRGPSSRPRSPNHGGREEEEIETCLFARADERSEMAQRLASAIPFGQEEVILELLLASRSNENDPHQSAVPQAGRHAQALSCCRQSLENDPENADALHLMGALDLLAGRYDFDAGMSVAPSH